MAAVNNQQRTETVAHWGAKCVYIACVVMINDSHVCTSVTPADFSGLAAVTPAAVPAPSVNSGLEPPPGLHCLLTGLKTYVDNLKLSVFERCLYVGVPVVCTCVCVPSLRLQ